MEIVLKKKPLFNVEWKIKNNFGFVLHVMIKYFQLRVNVANFSFIFDKIFVFYSCILFCSHRPCSNSLKKCFLTSCDKKIHCLVACLRWRRRRRRRRKIYAFVKCILLKKMCGFLDFLHNIVLELHCCWSFFVGFFGTLIFYFCKLCCWQTTNPEGHSYSWNNTSLEVESVSLHYFQKLSLVLLRFLLNMTQIMYICNTSTFSIV